MSLNDLPSREQLARAISPWWSGGGTTSLILDECRYAGASLAEAAKLAERMASRVAKGQQFVSREVVSEQLEMIRAVAALESSPKNERAEGIGSAAWIERATEMAHRSWERFFPGKPYPGGEEADRRYAELVRRQHDDIAETINRKREPWETA